MINILTLSSLALATLHMAVVPAFAHGYVSCPPSRQARCRDDQVPGCGPVKYEPQSVEGLHGSFKCNGNGARFPELNDDALWKNYFYPVPPGVHALKFVWTLPAPHRTTTFEYFSLTDDNTLLDSFNCHNNTPTSPVVHEVSLHHLTGRQTILARWNIGDTNNSFYSCVDLHIESDDIKAVAGAAANRHPAVQHPIGITLVVQGIEQ
jgi:predicted carbohydrate-binding protein with CBM5 and CBM33 domain